MDMVRNYLSQFTRQQKVLMALMIATFCIAMNYVSRNMGGGGIQLPYNNFSWIAGATFIFFSLVFAVFNKSLKLSKGALFYFLVVALLLLPLAYTNRLFLDVETLRFTGFGAGLLFLVCLYQNKGSSLKSFWLNVLFASTLIQTLWGLLQYYVILEPSVLFYRADLGRPYGVFQQVNDFTSYLALGTMFAIYYGFTSKSLSTLKLSVLAFIVFANFHLGILADADAALAISLVSVLIYLAYFAVTTKRYSLLLIFLSAALIGTLIQRDWVDIRNNTEATAKVASVAAAASEEVSAVQSVSSAETVVEASKNESEQNAGGEASTLGPLGTRATIYPVVVEMIKEKPWMGYGVGSFPKQYLLAQGEYLLDNPGAPGEFHLNHPHNELLYWVVELGMFTVVPFILLLVGWIYGMRKGVIDSKTLLLALPLVLHSLVELPFYHTTVHFLAFLLILFCADKTKGLSIRLPKFSWVIVAPALLFAFVQVQIFLLSTMHALQMFLAFNQTDRQEIKLLTGVNNPAAFKHRFEFELFQWQLQKGLKEGRIAKQELLNYIYWAFSVTQYAPLQSTYENFVDALAIYGNRDAALKYAEEGLLMYPSSDKLKRRVGRLKSGK